MYFSENQTTGFSPHERLTPKESANIIIDHVSEGLKIAKKHNLPNLVVDFIETHHGTSLVTFFTKSKRSFIQMILIWRTFDIEVLGLFQKKLQF